MAGEFLARKKRGRIEGVIFHWRSADPSTFRMTVALVVASALVAGFLFFVRVHVVPLPRPSERKGELIMIPRQSAVSDWATLALESGPFPSRFEPAKNAAVLAMERDGMANLPLQSGDYRPRLRDWPTESRTAATIATAVAGQRVLPKPEDVAWTPPATSGAGALLPTLYPLSPLPAGVWPASWPKFESELEPAAATVEWRFMVRLAADGRVSDCVALSGTNEPGAAEIEGWLRKVRFGTAMPAGQWFVVGTRVIQAP